MKITIGIADDHQLLLKSLSILINGFEKFEVITDALNGQELIEKLGRTEDHPDILLIDVQMPVMDGIKTTEIISSKYPYIKIIALSSKDDDMTVIQMIRAGCCAYLVKDIHPTEFEKALVEVYEKGYYNADSANVRFRRLIRKAHEEESLHISEKEKLFLKLACSDLTYKQIADKMHLAERTIDGYRESLFQKLNVQSRVGMVLEGIKKGLIIINECRNAI